VTIKDFGTISDFLFQIKIFEKRGILKKGLIDGIFFVKNALTFYFIHFNNSFPTIYFF